jgi:hypothetical protein
VTTSAPAPASADTIAVEAVAGAGVADLLRTAGTELVHTMALAGRPRLTDIDASATTPAHGGPR